MVWILSIAVRAETLEVRGSWNSERFRSPRIQVELVSIVAAKSRDTIFLESPFSLWRAGNEASASRTIQNQ